MIFLAILKAPNTIRYSILQYYIGTILKYCVRFIAVFSMSVYNGRQILRYNIPDFIDHYYYSFFVINMKHLFAVILIGNICVIMYNYNV